MKNSIFVVMLFLISCGPPDINVSRLSAPIAEWQEDAEASQSSATTAQKQPPAEESAGEPAGPPEVLSAPPPAELFLNEIYYDAPDADTDGDVFIELWGTPLGNIAGYKILLINGEDGQTYATITFPDDAKIGDGGFYVVADAKTGDGGQTNVLNFDLIANFDPQNGPDGVQLMDAAGGLVDNLCYGDMALENAQNGQPTCGDAKAPDAPSGQSIERTEAGTFIINEAPSPGEIS